MLSPFADGVWVAHQPLKYMGLSVGARMTVMKLADGRLMVHSPIFLTDELHAEVDKLGKVALLLAPNKYHHLFVKDWQAAYPSAQAWAAPGLPKKRRDVSFTGVVEDGAGPWAPDVEHVCWRGAPIVNEVVVFHRPSRTLVTCDLVHNLLPPMDGYTKFTFTLLGGFGGVKTNLLDRVIQRDRPAARASLERVLAWDFDRLVMAHGTPVPTGARDLFTDAYRWLRG